MPWQSGEGNQTHGRRKKRMVLQISKCSPEEPHIPAVYLQADPMLVALLGSKTHRNFSSSLSSYLYLAKMLTVYFLGPRGLHSHLPEGLMDFETSMQRGAFLTPPLLFDG